MNYIATHKATKLGMGKHVGMKSKGAAAQPPSDAFTPGMARARAMN